MYKGVKDPRKNHLYAGRASIIEAGNKTFLAFPEVIDLFVQEASFVESSESLKTQRYESLLSLYGFCVSLQKNDREFS